MVYQGLGSLRSIHDLYKKLTKDYQRMLDNEGDPYCAFDFFVTAYHMVDWLYPNSRKHQRELEKSEVLLQLCSHIANGAKHFKATAKKHQSVRSIRNGIVVNVSHMSEKNVVQASHATNYLYIELDGDAKVRLGQSIEAKDLAWKILEFWRRKLYP